MELLKVITTESISKPVLQLVAEALTIVPTEGLILKSLPLAAKLLQRIFLFSFTPIFNPPHEDTARLR